MSLNPEKHMHLNVYTIQVKFLYFYKISYFRTHYFLVTTRKIVSSRLIVGVQWPSGLVHWICVLMAALSECGFEPRPRPWCLVSLSKTLYHNCFSPPRSKWVPVRAELVVFD